MLINVLEVFCIEHMHLRLAVGVDRLSAPILSIFTIIDIGHFQNRFADNFFLL